LTQHALRYGSLVVANYVITLVVVTTAAHVSTRYLNYTHVAIYADRSPADYLRLEDSRIVQVHPRFLPLTMNSKGSALTFLVPCAPPSNRWRVRCC
jgi:hypothetical protein